MARGDPPDDYLGFVEEHAAELRRAALAAAGQDAFAERAVRDALSTLAARWRWTPAERRLAAAHRLVRRELVDFGRGQAALPGFKIVGVAERPPDPPALLARATWSGADRVRHRAWLVGGLALAVVAALALVGHASGRNLPRPVALPRSLPSRTQVIPDAAAQAGLPRRLAGLPARIAFGPPARTPTLMAHPVRRARAAFETRLAVWVLGDDGALRVLDQVPDRAGLWLTPGSLSGDGTRLILTHRDVVLVVTLTTGRTRPYEIPGYASAASWLPDGRVLLGQSSRSLILDPATGRAVTVPYGAADIAVDRAPASQLIELVPATSLGSPRIRVWAAGPGTGSSEGGGPTPQVALDQQLSLPADGHWIGAWEGPGWRRVGLVARDTTTGGLLVPAEYGTPLFATAVLDSSGRLVRALLQTSDSVPLTAPVALGWLDDHSLLVRAGDGLHHHLLAWDIRTGGFALVSTMSQDATTAWAGPD